MIFNLVCFPGERFTSQKLAHVRMNNVGFDGQAPILESLSMITSDDNVIPEKCVDTEETNAKLKVRYGLGVVVTHKHKYL